MLYALNTRRDADTTLNWQNLSMEIVKNKKSLTIIGNRGDSIVYSQVLKGKWKGDYFKSRSKTRSIGVPFIYFRHYKSRIYVCSDADKIYVRKMHSRYGNIFIMSAGTTDFYFYEFDKIK